MASAKKDTIYIDIDDDITAIIDKIKGAPQKIVALVLPKHAPTLQSSVNMKLVKRASILSNKHVVLITTETALLPLAGDAGLYVAKTLQSKPVVPVHADDTETVEKIGEGTASTAVAAATVAVTGAAVADIAMDPVIDTSRPLADLMKYGAAGAAKDEPARIVDPETEGLDEDVREMIEAPTSGELAENTVEKLEEKPVKKKLDRKLLIPNFNAFRLKLIGAFAFIVILIIVGIVCLRILPKATITVMTDTTSKDVALDFVASTATTTAAKDVIPAQSKDSKQALQEVVTATGTKDLGTRAIGSVIITNCTDNDVTIPVGTGVSSGALTYLTNKTVVVPSSNFFSAANGGACKNNGTVEVNVTSIAAGDKYNADAKSYAIADVSVNVTGAGTSMSGGTTKVVKVVTSQDVEGAKAKILTKVNANAEKDLKKQLTDLGFIPIDATYNEVQAPVKSVPAVGEEATNVTVSMDITDTMVGVNKSALDSLINTKLTELINSDKQKAISTGLAKATIKITDSKDPKNLKATLETVAVIGPKIDPEQLKKAIVGKKVGDVRDYIRALPSVKDATVEFSPFWVYSAPKNLSKITLTIKGTDGADGTKP